jgi:hypothetical protein
MRATSSPHRILHLVVEGFPPARLRELASFTREEGDVVEVFQLTEASAREALEKIFESDTIAVWGNVDAS